MQRLEVNGTVRPLQGSLGVKGLSERLTLYTSYFITATNFTVKRTNFPRTVL